VILEGIIDEMGKSPIYFEIAMILTVLSYIMLTVAEWKLFTKAGEKGWKALIPFYSIFVSHHLIGMRHIWFILDIVFWAAEIALEMIKGVPLWIEDTFFYIAILLTIMSEILHIMKLCYCYTKSELFGIGLFLLPPVFSLILAFDKSEYNLPRSHRERAEKLKASGKGS